VRPEKLSGRSTSSILGAASLALLVVVAVFVGGCGGEQANEQDGTQQKTESTEKTAASIGEPLTVGSVQWTVTDARQQNEIFTPSGSEQGNFISIDVAFTNNSNQDITLATPFLALVDSQGDEYQPDIDANFMGVEPSKNMFADQVEPGATKEGTIIFSVDSGTSGFKLRVGEARFASNKTGYIDLGL
jgi:Domain of unknown function (DUF4352)